MRKEFKKGLDHPLMELARARKAMSEVEGTAAEIDNYISTRFAELMEKYDKASPEDLMLSRAVWKERVHSIRPGIFGSAWSNS